MKKRLIEYKERRGVGIEWLWYIENSVFQSAAEWHDIQYELKSAGKQSMSRKEVDREFYRRCLEIAGDNKMLRAQAKFFYGIVRGVGWIFWWT